MESSKLNSIRSINSNELIDILNKLSKTEPIKKWDLGASCSKDHSVQVDKGEAKQLKGAQRCSITLRVWNKEGLVGTTSTTELNEKGLIKAFNAAYQASKYGNPDDVPDFSPLAKAKLPKLHKPVLPFKGLKELLKILRSAENDLLKQHPSIKTVPYNGLAETIFQRVYLNSEGAQREMKSSQASVYLYARAEEEGKKPRSSGAVRLAHGVEELEISSCIQEAASRTISHLIYQPIETGRYTICFKPDAFLELLGAFSSMFNARSVLDGISLSNINTLGTKISVPILSLYDNAIHPSNVSSCAFDGEGTPTRDLCIIKEGKLENFLHSEATARRFGVNPNGHAGLGSKVSVGVDWLVVKKNLNMQSENQQLNHKSYKDPFILIEGLNALHAGVKPSQGSFSLPFDGWLVNRGEKISIEAATVAGDIKEVLNNIIQIEEQQETTHQGISPHVWVDGLSITGEE